MICIPHKIFFGVIQSRGMGWTGMRRETQGTLVASAELDRPLVRTRRTRQDNIKKKHK